MTVAVLSFALLLVRVAIVGLFLLSGVLVARSFGPEGKGLYDLFLAVLDITVIGGSLGIGTAAIYLWNRKKESFKRLFSNSLLWGLGWGTILGILLFVFLPFLPGASADFSRFHLLLASASVPFTLLHNYLLSLLLARLQIAKWSFVSLGYMIFILAGIVLFSFGFGLGIEGVFLAVLGSSILTSLFIFWALLKRDSFPLVFSVPVFKEQIQFGLKAYLRDLFELLHLKGALLLVSVFLGAASVGYYSVALNMIAFLFLIPSVAQQILYPFWTAREKKDMDRMTALAARLMLLLGIGAVLIFLGGGRPIIQVLYGEEFFQALLPLFVLLPGAAAMMVASILFANFFARGKPHIPSGILFGVFLSAILLSIVFIPSSGLLGAALAMSISYGGGALFTLLFFSFTAHVPMLDLIGIRPSDVVFVWSHARKLLETKKFMKVTPALTLDKIKEFYEKKAVQDARDIVQETFLASSPLKRLLYAMRLNAVMKLLDVKAGERVLDAGCGVGYYTQKIAEKTSRVVAADIAEEYLKKAQELNPHPIEAYISCPVEHLPFSDNSFDKVLLSEVIEHVLDPRQALEEVRRVLKPGGRAVITTPNRHAYLNVIYHMKVSMSGPEIDRDHIKEFIEKEFRQLLGTYFVITEFRYVNYFPAMMPQWLAKALGFERLERFIERIETVLNSVPWLKRVGLSMVAQVQK